MAKIMENEKAAQPCRGTGPDGWRSRHQRADLQKAAAKLKE